MKGFIKTAKESKVIWFLEPDEEIRVKQKINRNYPFTRTQLYKLLYIYILIEDLRFFSKTRFAYSIIYKGVENEV